MAVMIDWKMPDMDGIETARAIRQEVGSEIPIIILSAYDWSSVEEEARKAGVNEHLTKPLNVELLIKYMKYWLGKDDCSQDR